MGKLDPSKTSLADLLTKFGGEKVIGIMHAFLLLKPLIKEAIHSKEKQILIKSNTKAIDPNLHLHLEFSEKVDLQKRLSVL